MEESGMIRQWEETSGLVGMLLASAISPCRGYQAYSRRDGIVDCWEAVMRPSRMPQAERKHIGEKQAEAGSRLPVVAAKRSPAPAGRRLSGTPVRNLHRPLLFRSWDVPCAVALQARGGHPMKRAARNAPRYAKDPM